jgi:hypothetical protein
VALLDPAQPRRADPRGPALRGGAERGAELGWLLYSAVVSVVVFFGGWKLFHALEPAFADRV